ncbi:MAG: hypothetical protein JO301_04130 [Chitinophagaceae bacterium]|nr:hypothetical protein [Chitinophagaceae bacterium]
MNISTAHLPAFYRSLEEAVTTGKDWIGYDAQIEQLSRYDMHFFDGAGRAVDFQHFNYSQEKEIVLLPTEALLGYIKQFVAEKNAAGIPFSHIEIDDEKVLGYYADLKFSERCGELGDLMDRYNWRTIVYEPGTLQAGAAVDERIQYNGLEYLIEQLSEFSKSGERARELVRELVERHWQGTAMEGLIKDVVAGHLIIKHETFIEPKNSVMNTENLEYLQNQLKFLGFGEGLNTLLEARLKEGMPDFQLQASHSFGKDPMEATLYFKKSEREGVDMYFFNKYEAALRQGERNLQQTFFINNKVQSVTFKEACNLLNGRAVFKELTPKEGEKYKAWLQLDLSSRDQYGNAKVKHYNENFGYDVKEAIGRVPIKELSDPDKMQSLVAALEKGNLATVTLIKDGIEKPVQITAEPQFKTLKMFDMEGKKLYVPAERQDQRYGQAPADEKRQTNGQAISVGELLPGNGQEKKAGQKIA